MFRFAYSSGVFVAFLLLGAGAACGDSETAEPRDEGGGAEVLDGTNPSDSGDLTGLDDSGGGSDATGTDGSLDTLAPEGDTGAPSDGLADAGPDATDGVAGLAPGEACASDDDCASGWCVPSVLGVICVDVCRDRCENDWSCIPAAGVGPDETYLCVPLVAPNPPPGDTVGGDTTSDTIGGDTVGGDTSTEDVVDPPDSVPGDTAPDPDVIEDTSTTDTTTAPDGTVNDTTGGDGDGDGIPDDEDNLPCLAIYLVVFNENVTSASIELNGVEAISANEFPTLDPISRWLNPVTGSNTLSLGGKLTGSPRDTLTLVVLDTAGHVYFSQVIVREPGQPRDYNSTFEVNVTCP